jgi:hypothetical protein
MQPDYSIEYMTNPFHHLRGLGYTSGEWEEWDTTPIHVTGGNRAVRYTKLEIEMPEWLDELVLEHPAPDGTPVAATVAESAKQQQERIRLHTAMKMQHPNNLFYRFVKWFRHEPASEF